MNKHLRKFVQKIEGKKAFQKLFGSLLSFSLRGLNFGNGAIFELSGEMNILPHIRQRFVDDKSIIIFDVGANVGEYTKALYDFFGEQVSIHAFEPSKITFDMFLEKTKCLRNVIANNIGLSDRDDVQLLYSDSYGSTFASVYNRNIEKYNLTLDLSEKINLSTIDHYCEKNNIDRIHFLKLDIEGHELFALRGAGCMINNKRIDIIQFEFGECNIDSRTYFKDFYYLLRDKYQIFRILKNGLIEVKFYSEINEIFSSTNYLAVLK